MLLVTCPPMDSRTSTLLVAVAKLFLTFSQPSPPHCNYRSRKDGAVMLPSTVDLITISCLTSYTLTRCVAGMTFSSLSCLSQRQTENSTNWKKIPVAGSNPLIFNWSRPFFFVKERLRVIYYVLTDVQIHRWSRNTFIFLLWIVTALPRESDARHHRWNRERKRGRCSRNDWDWARVQLLHTVASERGRANICQCAVRLGKVEQLGDVLIAWPRWNAHGEVGWRNQRTGPRLEATFGLRRQGYHQLLPLLLYQRPLNCLKRKNITSCTAWGHISFGLKKLLNYCNILLGSLVSFQSVGKKLVP